MIKKETIKIFLTTTLIFLTVGIVLGPTMVSAAGLVPCGGSAEDPCTLCHLIVGIKDLIDYGFKIMVFVALAAITAAGIWYIISAGDSGMMESAKGFAKNVLIGFAVILGAWLIVNTTLTILGSKIVAGQGSNLGFASEGWGNISCSTVSSAGSAGSGTSGADGEGSSGGGAGGGGGGGW